ncbi:MAG: lipoprotein-releasing ABC transporter permease subunit [Betaproteobacteria bacterium]|nr:lipoprotein-releasing ABC transporter permease subunit [Betaproteobacteria bacterium]
MLKLEFSIGFRYALVGRGDRYVSLTSAISVLGIALGVAAVIIVQSVMNGFHLQLRERILGASSHLELQESASTDLSDWPAMVEQIAKMDQVLAAAPVIDRQALVASDHRSSGVIVKGIDPRFEGGVTDLSPEKLRLLEKGGFKAILGDNLATSLNVAAGDRIVLFAPSGTTTIAGTLPRLRRITVAETVDFGIHQYDSALLYLHLEDARSIFRAGATDNIRVKVADPYLAPQIGAELEKIHKVRAYDWTRSNATFFQALAIERRVMFVILSLIIVVAAFQIVSALVAMVRSKRGDIAILRTLGAQSGSVLRIFLVQGLLVGVAGTVAGVLLGIAGSVNITAIVSFVENLFGVDLFPGRVYSLEEIPAQLVAGEVAAAALVALAVSLAATIPPSLAAARIEPAEALRHE